MCYRVGWQRIKGEGRGGGLRQEVDGEAGQHGRVEHMSRQTVNEQSCLLPSSSQEMTLGKRNLSLGGLNLLPSPGLRVLLSTCVSVLSVYPQEGLTLVK